LLVDPAGNAYITGTSPGASNLLEWATLKYLPDGTNAWIARFGGYTNANFRPLKIQLGAQARVFVAGTAPGQSGAGTDLLVLKYTQWGAQISRTSATTLHLEFVGSPGTTNRLQRAVNLPVWDDLATLVADAEGFMQYDVAIDPANGQSFYRTISP
jgi:hypothetical protein